MLAPKTNQNRVLDASWGVLGHLGRVLARLGGLLGRLWPILGRLGPRWAVLERLGGVLGTKNHPT